jgi:hypothetical protein
VKNGEVDFISDGRMKWSTNGDPGKWEGPIKNAVLLRWKKGDIDMLKFEGNKLSGKNAKGWKVEGTKQ